MTSRSPRRTTPPSCMDGPLWARANRQNGPLVWSGHVFGFYARPDTGRLPRWVTRIGFQALRRAERRDDGTECPDPGPDLCAVAAVCSLPGHRPGETIGAAPLTGKGCFLVRLNAPFLRPGLHSDRAPGAAAVNAGRRPPPKAARSGIDGGEHGARLRQVGRHQLRPQPEPAGDTPRLRSKSPRRSARSSPPVPARQPSPAGAPVSRAATLWRDRRACAHAA